MRSTILCQRENKTIFKVGMISSDVYSLIKCQRRLWFFLRVGRRNLTFIVCKLRGLRPFGVHTTNTLWEGVRVWVLVGLYAFIHQKNLKIQYSKEKIGICDALKLLNSANESSRNVGECFLWDNVPNKPSFLVNLCCFSGNFLSDAVNKRRKISMKWLQSKQSHKKQNVFLRGKKTPLFKNTFPPFVNPYLVSEEKCIPKTVTEVIWYKKSSIMTAKIAKLKVQPIPIGCLIWE